MCRCFDVDPRRGAFRVAGGLFLAILQLRSTVRTCTRRHTHTHVNTWTRAVGGSLRQCRMVFHETGEWAATHHTCQILSALQPPGNRTQPDFTFSTHAVVSLICISLLILKDYSCQCFKFILHYRFVFGEQGFYFDMMISSFPV